MDYNRRMHNFFEAGLIRHYPGLRNYPRTIPDYPATHGQFPNFCKVSVKLTALHE